MSAYLPTGAGPRDDDHPEAPPETIWIYSFQGTLPPQATSGLPHFLGTWVEEELSFLFFTRPADDTVQALQAAHPRTTWLDSYQMAYEEWIGGELTPFTVGGVHVRPVWERQEAPADRACIDLDPGVVFGGGTHPTTLDCLKALNFIARETGGSVLDLGSGTGILSLAAARLGWDKVVAVDLNPLAARTSRANVRLNTLDDRILAVQGKAEEMIHIPAGTVVANIHYDVMLRLVSMDAFTSKRWFVLSGLLRSQAMDVLERLKASGALIEAVLDDGTWFTLVGRHSLNPLTIPGGTGKTTGSDGV